jgi:hypothetical protein
LVFSGNGEGAGVNRKALRILKALKRWLRCSGDAEEAGVKMTLGQGWVLKPFTWTMMFMWAAW